MQTLKPHPTNTRRWWLWWPLLAVLAWLVWQEQMETMAVEEPSLPTRATAHRTPVARSATAPQAGSSSLAPIPRAQLFAAKDALRPSRDLFASRHPTPLPAAAVVDVIEAPSAPPLPYRYVGKQWDGQAWEVYAVLGNQTYVLREGLVLDERYRVDHIEPPHAALTYLPLGTPQQLFIGDTR